MSDTLFNPDDFLNTETSEVFETNFTPIPEEDYPAVIMDVKARTTSKGAPLMDVHWLIDDQKVRDLLGTDEPICRQTIWLDIVDGRLESGPNKNVQLGKLREALSQLDGKPWRPSMLIGCPGIVQVKHSDPNPDTGAVFSNVTAVRKM